MTVVEYIPIELEQKEVRKIRELVEKVIETLLAIRNINPEVPENRLLHVPYLYQIVLYGDLMVYGETFIEGELIVY